MKTRILLVLLAFASAALAGSETVEEILSALESPTFAGRRDAVRAAAGRTEPVIQDRLLAMALGDPHPNIRGFAIEALAGRRDERFVTTCLAVYRDDDSFGPRGAALEALGRSRDPRALPLLREALADRGMRYHAVVGLGHNGDPVDFEPIRDLWLADPADGWLCSAGPEALYRIDPLRARKLVLSKFAAVPPPARYSLAEVLREHPDEVVREKMTVLLSAPDADLRARAARVLGRVGDGTTVPALTALLTGPKNARDAAVGALEEIGDAAAAPALARTLATEQDPVTVVRLIGALAKLGDRHAVASIVPFLEDPRVTRQPMKISSIWGYPWNLRVRSAALWALVTLVDGQEPLPRKQLSGFPEPPPEPWADRHGPRIRDCWSKHEHDPEFRFPD